MVGCPDSRKPHGRQEHSGIPTAMQPLLTKTVTPSMSPSPARVLKAVPTRIALGSARRAWDLPNWIGFLVFFQRKADTGLEARFSLGLD